MWTWPWQKKSLSVTLAGLDSQCAVCLHDLLYFFVCWWKITPFWKVNELGRVKTEVFTSLLPVLQGERNENSRCPSCYNPDGKCNRSEDILFSISHQGFEGVSIPRSLTDFTATASETNNCVIFQLTSTPQSEEGTISCWQIEPVAPLPFLLDLPSVTSLHCPRQVPAFFFLFFFLPLRGPEPSFLPVQK